MSQSGSKLFDTLVMIQKVNIEKRSDDNKILPACKELNKAVLYNSHNVTAPYNCERTNLAFYAAETSQNIISKRNFSASQNIFFTVKKKFFSSKFAVKNVFSAFQNILSNRNVQLLKIYCQKENFPNSWLL